eukprot:6931148-Prymnesium_polylepis.2
MPLSVPTQSTLLRQFSMPAPIVTASGCSLRRSGTMRPLIRSEIPPSNQISASGPYWLQSSSTAARLMSSNCSCLPHDGDWTRTTLVMSLEHRS